MHTLQKLSCIILGLACLLPNRLCAATTIPTFIDSNRRNKEIVVNEARYDKKAKLFFLAYLGYNTHQGDKLEAATRPLIPAWKKIRGKGADIILYLDFPPEQKNKKGKSRNNTPALEIKCPIINIYPSQVRDILFQKDARGKDYSYGTYELRAVDTKGSPIAYFSQEQDGIVMRDAGTGDKVILCSGGYKGNEWMGPAILAAHEKLAQTAGSEEGSKEASGNQKKPKKKSGRKRKNNST